MISKGENFSLEISKERFYDHRFTANSTKLPLYKSQSKISWFIATIQAICWKLPWASSDMQKKTGNKVGSRPIQRHKDCSVCETSSSASKFTGAVWWWANSAKRGWRKGLSCRIQRWLSATRAFYKFEKWNKTSASIRLLCIFFNFSSYMRNWSTTLSVW